MQFNAMRWFRWGNEKNTRQGRQPRRRINAIINHHTEGTFTKKIEIEGSLLSQPREEFKSTRNTRTRVQSQIIMFFTSQSVKIFFIYFTVPE
jgi:hypothetical protein